MKKYVKIAVFVTISVGISMIARWFNAPQSPTLPGRLLAERSISLETRYNDSFVNGVFKDNILLTLAYMTNRVKNSSINWNMVRRPFTSSFILQQGEVFAFHEDVLPEYRGKVAYTTRAHFNYSEGFKSDGYLMGDGVCHLASLLNWVAKDSELEVVAPTNHDFAIIPEVPREYGTSIYSHPENPEANAVQNLYVKNTMSNPVLFMYEYKNNTLKISVYEVSSEKQSNLVYSVRAPH